VSGYRQTNHCYEQGSGLAEGISVGDVVCQRKKWLRWRKKERKGGKVYNTRRRMLCLREKGVK